MLKLKDVQSILEAELLCGQEYLESEALSACGADLMSDVLAFTKQKTLLLTGLTNIQVVRTAEISDLVGIVFVRGKCPSADIIKIAKEKGIPLMITFYPMYEACGLLFKNNLSGCFQRADLSGD